MSRAPTHAGGGSPVGASSGLAEKTRWRPLGSWAPSRKNLGFAGGDSAIWYGMVWYGMIWYGMVRCSLVRCGVAGRGGAWWGGVGYGRVGWFGAGRGGAGRGRVGCGGAGLLRGVRVRAVVVRPPCLVSLPFCLLCLSAFLHPQTHRRPFLCLAQGWVGVAYNLCLSGWAFVRVGERCLQSLVR